MNKDLENIDIINDFLNIYNMVIDSYNSRIFQTINEKYTIIDKATLAMYLYVKIIKKLNLETEDAKEVLISYVLRQTIYAETGNLDLEIADKSREKSYNEVIEKLIIEKFDYRNRNLKKLKYNYQTIKQNEFFNLIKFCEDISIWCILNKMKNRGNTEVIPFLKDLKNKLKNIKKSLAKSKTELDKEKIKIINDIISGKFVDTTYFKTIDVGLNLRDVYRYSTLTAMLPENVLFHQYTITLVSIIFSEYLNSIGENIDIYKIVVKSLFHDFSEFTGNEIVTQVKNYNEDTIKMFAEIEEKDEEVLKEKLGEDIYIIISEYKKEKEGYVSEVVDKVLGIMKLWIELEYMNNMKFIKSICSIFQSRFKRFKKIEEMDNIKNKEHILDIVREVYIFLKENMMDKNEELLLQEFTKEEIKEFRKEIKLIKKNKKEFLA